MRNPAQDSFQLHRLAVRHLDAIDQLLDEMAAAGSDVSVYRKYFPEWCSAVFAFPKGWDAAPWADITGAKLEHLQNLAEMLRYYVPAVEPDGLAKLRTYADDIRAALRADTSIPEPLRIHAHEVIQHLLWCVDQYDLVGDFILADAVERLAAMIVHVGANSSEETRNTVWSWFANNIVWPFGVSMMAAIPSQALAQLALGPGH